MKINYQWFRPIWHAVFRAVTWVTIPQNGNSSHSTKCRVPRNAEMLWEIQVSKMTAQAMTH